MQSNLCIMQRLKVIIYCCSIVSISRLSSFRASVTPPARAQRPPRTHKAAPARTEAGPEGSASCFRKTVSYFVSNSVSYSVIYSVRESMMGLMMPSITV
jgi:hypothetical protein